MGLLSPDTVYCGYEDFGGFTVRTYTLFFVEKLEPFEIPVWLGVFSTLDTAYFAAMGHELEYNWEEGGGYYSIMEMDLGWPKTAKRVCRIPKEPDNEE